ELENFRRKAAETRLELKEVRRQLRAESDALQFWTKVVNIALMPLLVAIAGIAYAVLRRRRKPALAAASNSWSSSRRPRCSPPPPWACSSPSARPGRAPTRAPARRRSQA